MQIAIQCDLLSRKGGGLPAAILPVAERLGPPTVLVTRDPPEGASGLSVLHPASALRSVLTGARFLGDEVQLVHTHGLWSPLSLAACIWRRRTGGPTVVSPHGMLDPWALNQSRTKKALVWRAVEKAHLSGSAVVHALNAAEAGAIRAAGVRAPIEVIPNGIDLPAAEPPPPPDWLNRPTLLFLGRLHEKKGIAELIKAWSAVAPSLPEWQLAIAGWDDGPNDFRALAGRGEGSIVFPGPLFGDDKVAAYAHSSAFILPSYSEGLPMTVLEAWANGKPVLMTDACNLPEGFAAGAAARITTDPRDLGEAILHHLQDAAFLSGAGQAGRELVARTFSWDVIADQFRTLYERTIETSLARAQL